MMSTDVQTHTTSELSRLHKIGTYPNDYTRDDLIQYVTVVEAQAYMDGEQIDTLKARVKKLEQQLAAQLQAALA
jgi:hypothetical protein